MMTRALDARPRDASERPMMTLPTAGLFITLSTKSR
jgi:hypothetical protein